MRWVILIAWVLLFASCKAKQPTPADFLGASPAPEVLTNLPPQVWSFIDRKEQFALRLAKNLGVEADRSTLKYFKLARKGLYRDASQIYQDLRERGGKIESPRHDPELRLPLWDPLLEVQLAMDAYASGAGQFATIFGEYIVRSIPQGSIYFGGTDPGRSLVAAFSAPTPNGAPFLLLTQNQLVDGQHLNYLRVTFGEIAHMPSGEDVQECFQAYLEDARKRYQHDLNFPEEPHQLKAGENVKIADGRTEVAGPIPVMAINGLLTKVVFDRNPGRDFYLEESAPIDWMYPHLTPHGFIMKINRQPVGELTPAIIEQDRMFWNNHQSEWIGNWLTSDTQTREVCAFIERVFVKKDFSESSGNEQFIRNVYSTVTFSKLRSSQADVYAWRLRNAKSPEERDRMKAAATFAFLQSLALCPTNPEAVYGYVNLLVLYGRLDDARLVAQTAAKVAPAQNSFGSLLEELSRIRSSTSK